jgi:hypothetical protein
MPSGTVIFRNTDLAHKFATSPVDSDVSDLYSCATTSDPLDEDELPSPPTADSAMLTDSGPTASEVANELSRAVEASLARIASISASKLLSCHPARGTAQNARESARPAVRKNTTEETTAKTVRSARYAGKAERTCLTSDVFDGTEFLIHEIRERRFLERLADSRSVNDLGLKRAQGALVRSRSPTSPPRQCCRSHCDSHSRAANSWYCACGKPAGSSKFCEDRLSDTYGAPW